MLITLRQLQYICAVAETKSFSKAAKVCHAEQSTVSQQIKLLEDRLGVKIFRRNCLPVEVTIEGEQIIEKATEILDSVTNLIEPFKNNPNRFG